MRKTVRSDHYLFGFVLPLLAVGVIWLVDLSEGSTHTLIGILACIPGLAAILGAIWMVQALALICLVSALVLGSAATEVDPQVLNFSLLVIVLVSILSLVAVQLRIKSETRIADLAAQAAAAESAEKHAVTDFLTGHLNRYGVIESLQEVNSKEVTVVIFDFDKFKDINDIHGHQIGDGFIKAVSARIAANFKDEDIFGRWGGDEFLAILNTPQDQAINVVKRVISTVSENPLVVNGVELPVRFSAGLSVWNKTESFEQAFKRADKALYEAKARGGQQAVSFDELPNHGEESPHAH